MGKIKLGLKTTRVNNGDSTLFETNQSSDWVNKTRDIRDGEGLGYITNLEKGSEVIMLTSINTGLLITCVKLIGGRGGDNVCAWIYVPASADVKGKELKSLIAETIDSINDKEKLEELFFKEYEQVPSVRMPNAVSSGGEKFAVRYYGEGTRYSLSDLLNDPWQPYYRDYKSVFLLGKEDNLVCDPSCENLTDKEVRKTMTVDAQNSKDGFNPYLDGRQFKESIRCLKGDTITVEWRKEGYKSKLMPALIKGTDGRCTIPVPPSDQFEKLIPYSAIKVQDEEGHSIDNYGLRIKNQPLTQGGSVPVKVECLHSVFVEVYVNGYEAFREHLDLTDLIKLQPIKLKKKTFTYVFSIPLETGRDGSVDLTVNEELKESPIKGYVTDSPLREGKDPINLHYNPYDRKFRKIALIAAIVVLVLGFCGGGAFTHFLIEPLLKGSDSRIEQLEQENKDLQSEDEGVSVENQEQESPAPIREQANVDSAAISYLDDNAKWIRPEMEKYEALKGLWDAVNERAPKKLRSHEEALSGSKNFKKVLKAVEDNSAKPFSRPTYCAPGDSVITIKKYVEELYNKQKSPSPLGSKEDRKKQGVKIPQNNAL